MNKYAIKNKCKEVKAYELGAGSAVEQQLLREGRLLRHADGTYELFSQEATAGKGELAKAGDYFKVDGSGFPYPNERGWFLSHHERIEGDTYRQLNQPLEIWEAEDGEHEVIRWLVDHDRLTLNPEDPNHFFYAMLWGAPLTAKRDAVVVFYSVDRSESGSITDVSFNFVARQEFERDYSRV